VSVTNEWVPFVWTPHDILAFNQVWSFVLSHIRLAPLIRCGNRNLKNP